MPKNDIRYGLSSFKTIRENSLKYIDKTESIYKMITQNNYVFLARPRRFGKTLLVDTLAEIFQGNKKLFRGLAISKKKYDWKSFPVIRLDMSKPDLSSSESLKDSLCKMLHKICKSLKVDPTNLVDTSTPKIYLSSIIEELAVSGQKVVVLIDEYDYPVINYLHEGEKVASSFLKVLQEFYLALKINSNYIHFLLLTGVTQLAHTTIFSGLNNLFDITYNPEFSDLLGYTQKELESNFKEEIILGARANSLSKKQFLDKVKSWYDGYRFSDLVITVYNPSDINIFFKNEASFKTYWISTGTPSFILKLLSKYPKFDLQQKLKNPRSNFFEHGVLDLDAKISEDDIISLLYQSGYLTITDINDKGKYFLDFPNKEVRYSFTNYLTSALYNKKINFFDSYTYIADYLIDGNPRKFVENLDTLFKSLSHPTQKYQENAIGLAISTILSLSQDIDVENQIHSGKGITDVVAITKDTIYIMELKVNGSAKKALSQIKDKEYVNLYKNKAKYKKKKIVLMGISFDSKDATVKDLAMDPVL